MMRFDEEGAIDALLAELQESGAFDKADRQQQADLETDTEWTRRDWTHLGTLLQAWAHGILSADAFYRGYRLPENFAAVFDHVSQQLQEKFPGEVVVQISLAEVRQWFKQWAMQSAAFRAWNERGGAGPGTIAWTSRYSPTPDHAEFIDLDVPSHNAAIWLRDRRRLDAAFDRRSRA
jgi:hypothetical protein